MATAAKKKPPPKSASPSARRPRAFIPVAEGARIVDMSRNYVLKLVRNGLIPYKTLPARKGVLVERAALERIARESIQKPKTG